MITSSFPSPSAKAFCVGQVKSGTGSLWGLLDKNFRAAHEPDREQLLGMILQESRGDVTTADFRTYLLQRDQRLKNEYDIAWANQFIIGHLLATFPDAKFIVLIRDVYTWLQSIVGHLISRDDVPAYVIPFFDFWFKPDRYPITHRDGTMKEHRLYSVEAYLRAWNDHVNQCTQLIPSEKRLIIKCSELNRSHQQIADFLRIPVDQLDTRKGHINRSTWSDQLESLVDPTWVDEMVEKICGENMAYYFPGVCSIEDAFSRWKVDGAIDG